MRSFTSGRAFGKALRWVRKGTTQDVQWVEHQVESSVDYVPALAKAAVDARVESVNLPSSYFANPNVVKRGPS